MPVPARTILLLPVLLIAFSGCPADEPLVNNSNITPDPNPVTGNELGPFDTAAAAIDAFGSANAGDHIVIKDGVYNNFDLNFNTGRNGTDAKRIFIRAQTPGGVTLRGKSRIRINNCSYVTISGFIFNNGFYGTGTSNAAILVNNAASHHIRITNILMDGYHSPTPEDDCRWVRVYGQYNEIDNCTFINKNSVGVTLEIVRSNAEPNYAAIHHNYFGFSHSVLENGSEMNGLETIRIGTSDESQSDSSSVVEYNYFEECNGEIEIISNKSGNNIYRGNVFLNSNGTLTLRHGKGCLVEDNIFININKSGMGGVRVIDRDHIIRNNYFENTTTGKRSGISMEYGVPDSPLNRYYPVINTIIDNNTFINNRTAINTGPSPGSDQTIAPAGTKAKNNLIAVASGTGTPRPSTPGVQIVYRNASDPAVEFTDTLAYGTGLQITASGDAPAGIAIANPQMSINADLLYMPGAAYKEYGMQLTIGKAMLKPEDTGASFAKGGKTH